MLDDQRIHTWIDDLPDACEFLPQTPTKPTRPETRSSPSPTLGGHKRKAQEPSPPATTSDMDNLETPVAKRKRLDRLADPELTPRPPHETSLGPTRAPSLSSDNTSGRSRSTSPLKRQILELRLDDTGLETKSLRVEALEHLPNPKAASLLRTMRRIGTCKGILPDDQCENILRSHRVDDNDLDDWESAFKAPRQFAGLPGRIPSPGVVDLVREWTTECIELKAEEAVWNTEVHFRLLEAVFREPGKKTGGLLNITTSYSARPHKSWLPKSTGSKMVDYLVYADTDHNDDASLETHKAFCRTTVTKSVNHTDFQLLQLRPIVLSIETKADNQNLDAAELQMGVWHAAQWAFLRSSILSVVREPTRRLPTAQELERTDEALSRLPFIPAIIVQGHRWLFVLSTRQGSKTILWKEYQFGSTSTVVETYQTVAGIRQLAMWAKEVYLPWFQEEILVAYKARP